MRCVWTIRPSALVSPTNLQRDEGRHFIGSSYFLRFFRGYAAESDLIIWPFFSFLFSFCPFLPPPSPSHDGYRMQDTSEESTLEEWLVRCHSPWLANSITRFLFLCMSLHRSKTFVFEKKSKFHYHYFVSWAIAKSNAPLYVNYWTPHFMHLLWFDSKHRRTKRKKQRINVLWCSVA